MTTATLAWSFAALAGSLLVVCIVLLTLYLLRTHERDVVCAAYREIGEAFASSVASGCPFAGSCAQNAKERLWS